MFAKTFCKPGSYLTVVPVGLRATLQYNANGVLEKIFNSYSDHRLNITDVILDAVKRNKLVPLTIPTKGGTTWVEGVFYTSKIFDGSGTLPMCVESSMMADIKLSPDEYTFYAGRVDSLAASFRAVLTARNWMKMSGFNLLPVFIVPDKLTNEAFVKMVNTDRYPFKFPLISGYMIFEGAEYKYLPLNLTQKIVKSVDRFNDSNGYIKANVVDTEGNNATYQYTDVINYGITKDSILVSKSNGKLIHSTTQPAMKKVNKLTCSVCGNTFLSPGSGPVSCSDPHCLSKLYPDVVRMLNTFELPVLSYDKFIKYVSKKKILCLTDVLILPEYKDAVVSVTVPKLLQGVVPVDVCADNAEFVKISYLCNHSSRTLRYYVENPDRLRIELSAHSTSLMISRLVQWISDPYNATTILTLLDSDQVTMIETDKKFEGAPIFRNKTIAITGKFRHGDSAEIISILRSYSANVTLNITDDADCLIIGDLNENIDGKSVQLARERGIPMFGEMKFFAQYQIDEDISANLL